MTARFRAGYLLVTLYVAGHMIAFSQSPPSTPRAYALLGPQPEIARVLTNSAGILDRTIPKLASEKDPAIQQVRHAMERERSALRDLIEALNKRETMLAELTDVSVE